MSYQYRGDESTPVWVDDGVGGGQQIGGAGFATQRGGRALTDAEMSALNVPAWGAGAGQQFTPPPGYVVFKGTPGVPLDRPILLPANDPLVKQTPNVGALEGLMKEALPQFLQGPAIPMGAAAGVGALSAAGLIPAGEVAGMGSAAAGGAGASGAAPVAGVAGGAGGGGSTMFNPLNMEGTGFTGNLADYGMGQSAFNGGSVVNAGGATLGGSEGGLLTGGSAAAGGMTAAGALTPGAISAIQAAGPTAMSAVKSLLDGGGSHSDLMDLLGKIAPAALGYVGATGQADAYSRLADRYNAQGQPYRDRLAGLYADPSSFLKSPEVTAPIEQAAGINARALSTGGNPTGSGNAMQAMNDFTATKLFSRLGEEKDRLAGFGGLSGYAPAARAADSAAINSQGSALNAVGAGFSNVFNPPPTLAQTMADFKRLSGATT